MSEQIHRTTFNLKTSVVEKARKVLAKKETLTSLVHQGLECMIRRRNKKFP